MKEWPIKAINQLICSKIGKRLLLQWEARKAAQWYGALFAMTSEVEPAYYYRYAQSLRSISENDKANQMEKFDQISGNDSRGKLCQNENYMDAIRLIQEI
jgi:tRNA G26 N,N-dimethylase Trm1